MGLVWLWAANVQGCAPVLRSIGMGHPAPDPLAFGCGLVGDLWEGSCH